MVTFATTSFVRPAWILCVALSILRRKSRQIHARNRLDAQILIQLLIGQNGELRKFQFHNFTEVAPDLVSGEDDRRFGTRGKWMRSNLFADRLNQLLRDLGIKGQIIAFFSRANC